MNFQPNYLSKESWEEIQSCKEQFIKKIDNPCESSYLDDDICASWIKSREMEIDPFMKIDSARLHLSDLKNVQKNNQLLIDIIQPLFKVFRNMTLFSKGYILYVCDRNGAFLAHEGEMLRGSKEGLVWNEKTIGTCVHSICMRRKQPAQLLGPEHYNVTLQNIIASAAPILDESGEVLAILILGEPMVEEPWLEEHQIHCSQTLAFITSIAMAVETLVKLNKSNQKLQESYDNVNETNEKLETMHNILETTFSIIDEGILTIDHLGNIVHTNKEGLQILKLKPEDVGHIKISKYLCEHSKIIDLIKRGKNIDIEETLNIGQDDEQSFLINIRPIVCPIVNNNVIEGNAAVLKLNNIKKVNTLAINRSGSIAKYTLKDICGEDEGFKKSLALAERFAHTSENILLLGESGTGKELFAQAIHNIYRPQGPFMAVNCAALPRELIESELFGYEGGSFTGAQHNGRPGKIELANEGTLFLDEIGDMPLELQAVLLRTLEDKQVMRIGGRRYKEVDFRLIAATNKDLMKMVNENQYREDLYFRLSVLSINISPLRKRVVDIEILSNLFIKNYSIKQGQKIPRISVGALKRLREYQWPGNVRQLQNAIIYAVNTAQDDIIELDDLPQYILMDSYSINRGNDEMLCLENLEQIAIGKALCQTNNNLPTAAELLGISRSTLYRKIKEYQIKC